MPCPDVPLVSIELRVVMKEEAEGDMVRSVQSTLGKSVLEREQLRVPWHETNPRYP